MANLNKVLLIGNLTKAPELRYTPQGTAVLNLRLAVNRKFKDRNQEMKEETCFITVVVWDKQAETCNQYLNKGSQIFVEGRLQSRSWDDNAGQKRSVIEVRAERVQFLGAPGGARNANAQENTNTQEQDVPKSETSTESEWLDESEDKINAG